MVITAKATAFSAAHPFVKAHFEIFRHGARLGAVIKRHHEHRQKDHRRNRADPVEMRGGDAVFRAAGGHADEFQRAEVGGDERQPGHPGRNRTAGRQKVRRGFHVTRQRPADADDKRDVRDQNCVIYPRQVNWLHNECRSFYTFSWELSICLLSNCNCGLLWRSCARDKGRAFEKLAPKH